MLRELVGDEPVAGIETIVQAQPDILHLTNIDFDAGLVTLKALQMQLADRGLSLDHSFARKPNTGMSTGLDIDGDGRRGGPRDAQGFGYFSGQGGQALLSRFPLELTADKSDVTWSDLSHSLIAPDDPAGKVQRVSSSAHWAVTVKVNERAVTLLTLAATPPVFDGPEDRNGRRNHDEVLLWTYSLAQEPGLYKAPVVLIGNFNLDPIRGEGIHAAAKQVLSHPRLQDPLPDLPTVEWERVGEMRVSYVLPDKVLDVVDAKVMPLEPTAGPHRLVWVDVTLN
ncbi:endonuclease/exonuclease/phosphatase family protein [uncultured Pelagimonas sp.]|uniref:endonuclease/exonuclease/phosphatase family protein n=1 Tax=uncultured Pelagimonas sp. TaxID=1618102 RepID=UPI0026201F1A|nr:endonuclease/exonuclease/phosphatase family protein [uncultured Pelagimonas sp.]